MENSPSPRRPSGSVRKTFTGAHRQPGVKHSLHWPMLQADVPTPQHLRVMYLQRRWQELKERERSAQQHNAQLLLQFDRAQEKLREMLACNTAMKTVRLEYERCLETNAPHWQDPMKENPAQRKRMEEYFTSHLRNLQEEEMRRLSADRILLLQGSAPQNISEFQNNQAPSLHRPPHTHPESDWFPTNATPPPHSSSPLQPPSLLPLPPHQLHLLTSALPPHHLWPGLDPSGATGIPSASEALRSQLSANKPPEEREAEAAGSRAGSETSDGSRGPRYSQELDMSPVRLSSGRAESGQSGGQTSGDGTERKKKREKTRQTSSHGGSCSPEDSSQTSSAVVIPVVAAGRRSESDTAPDTGGSGKGRGSKRRRRRRRKSGTLAASSPQMENESTEGERDEENLSASDESESRTDKDAEGRSSVDQSGGEEEDKIQKGDGVNEKKEREGSEEEEDEEEPKNGLIDERIWRDGGSSGEEGEEEEEKMVGPVVVRGDDEEDKLEDDEDNENLNEDSSLDGGEVDGDEDSIGEDEEESEEETEDEKEKNDEINEDEESSEEEERNEKKMGVVEEEEEEESGEEDGEDEEEQGGDEDDSDDSIISPQENRQRKIHVISEEEAEDEEGGEEDEETSGSETGSSAKEELSEDDIEDLLAPREQRKKPNEDVEDKDKVKAPCDYVEVFKVEEDSSSKSRHQSDSDEFDHFYD